MVEVQKILFARDSCSFKSSLTFQESQGLRDSLLISNSVGYVVLPWVCEKDKRTLKDLLLLTFNETF